MTENRTKKIRARENPLLADVLEENEKKANRLCCTLCMVFAGVCIVSALLNLFNLFKMSTTATIVSTVDVIILIAPVIMNKTGKFHSWIMKYAFLVAMFLATTFLDAAYNYNVALVIAMPVIMAALYFDIRTVVITFGATIVVFGTETYLAAYHMIFIDNNHIILPKGTALVITNGVKEALLSVGIDPADYALNSMIMAFLPRVLQLIVFFALAIAVAKYGQEMILRQADITAEQTRISTELSVANRLQADALPDVDEINGHFGFELAAHMTPARETGGDFYDFAMLDEDHLAIVIADVSDKGVPAAMFMMAAKSTINNGLKAGRKPSEIIASVNNRIFKRNKEGMFVTVWLGIYEISTGTLTSTNAGHEDPIMYTPGSGFAELKEQHGVLVGEFENMEYTDNVTKFNKGDMLFLYTDGVSEACNIDNEMYGVDRLLSCLNGNCVGGSMSAEEIKDAVKTDIAEFVQHAEQFDDLTMVVLKA